MGAQLGALFLQRTELPLVMKEIDEAVLEKARGHIEGALDERVAKGRMTAGRAMFLKSLVTYSTEDGALRGADFVIEAVLESVGLKQKIFGALEGVVSPGCVFATNTSSLSVTEIAGALEHPERVVGFHFFNPVKVLPLVELVRGGQTDDATFATAFEVASKLGKSAVACGDAPAFVVNRLLTRFLAPCFEAASAGTSFEAIDRAIEALGMPMGPLKLIGLVGPKIAIHTAESLQSAFPERFGADENLKRLADSGLPGVYGFDGKINEEARGLWETRDAAWSDEEIRQAALRAVADEAKRLLDEGVVADARDIDTCMILGAGWPFFMGGICMYLDQTGLSQELFDRRLVGARDLA
jgi:3-hydroxyacyl-CoA dehydrogenase